MAAHRLPVHLSIEDAVYTAVHYVLSGRVRFDPARMSLAAMLCGTVRKLVSPKGLAEFQQRSYATPNDELAALPAEAPDEECLFSPADHDRVFDLVRAEAGPDVLFARYIDAFRANLPADECARQLDVPVAKVYELNRKLKLLVRRVLLQLKPVDVPR